MGQATWSLRDYHEGRCKDEQVGKPRPDTPIEAPESVQDVLESLPPATLSEFKQAVLRVARDKHGSYDAFLLANPGFHQKFLMAMAREPNSPSSSHEFKLPDVPWLSRRRFAYKDPERLAEIKREMQDVVDAVVVEKTQSYKPADPSVTDAEVRAYIRDSTAH